MNENYVAIMQPHFLPWLGYFYLIDRAESFVILDNVQFDKRSWQQRNKFNLNLKEHWITIPVNSKNKFNQKINQVTIDYTLNFKKKHLNTISQRYKNQKFYNEILFLLNDCYERKHELLIDLNLDLIKSICKYLDININLDFASNLKAEGNKEILIKNIINIKNYRHYITPLGSREYMEKTDIFEDIKVKFIEYNGFKYKVEGNFYPNMSIIDLLFHHGTESLSFIRKSFNLIC